MPQIRLYGGPWHGRVLDPDREMASFVVPDGYRTAEYVPRDYEVSWQRRSGAARESLAQVTRYVCGDPRAHEDAVMQELLLGMTAALLLTGGRVRWTVPIHGLVSMQLAVARLRSGQPPHSRPAPRQ
jgi:hypothetical protein